MKSGTFLYVFVGALMALPQQASLGQLRPSIVTPWNDGEAMKDWGMRWEPNGGGIAGGLVGPQGAADHIISHQCPNGGWNWPHGGCGSTFNNITAPICEGLLQAYGMTGDADHLNAAVAGGNYDLTFQYPNGESRLSSFTAAFMRRLSAVSGNPIYSTFAETEYFDELAAGTYGPSDQTTATWIAALQAARSGGLINLRPWDLHQLPWVAGQIGNPGQQDAFRDAVLDGLATLDGVQPGVNPNYFGEIIGLAGGVRGLALNGTTTFPAISAPAYALIDGDTSLCQLADALASLQNNNGSWYWTANANTQSDEDTQTTAYAILALVAAQAQGCGPYTSEIALGRNYLAVLQDASGGYAGYPGGPHNIEVDGEALWAGPVGSDVSLNANACTNGTSLVVSLDKGVTTMEIVGGQFYLSYDTSKLSNPVVSAGDPPFTGLISVNTATPGEIDLATGLPIPPVGPGTTAAATMARIAFTVVGQTCNTASLVQFRPAPPNSPPLRLTDAEGNDIIPGTTNLHAITLDSTAPTLTCPATAQVECDPNDPGGNPGVLFATTDAASGVRIVYNLGQPEIPSEQAYFKTQYSQTNTNGAHLNFDTALLPPYNIPGLSWATLFGQAAPSQFGLDMVLPTPATADGSVLPPLLTAVDNANSSCAGATPAGNVFWAFNDYKDFAGGPPNPLACIGNSLFRSPGLNPSSVVVTRNIVTQSGPIFTAHISGQLVCDGLIHWFTPATPDSPVGNFGLTGMFFFEAVLTYDSTNDPGNDGDFYSGTITINANSPFNDVGIPTVSDNCDPLPEVTYTDVVTAGICPQERTIVRTWRAEDTCGNFSTCTQNIAIQDNTAPVITFCPANLTVDADAGTCGAVVAVGAALAQDFCDPAVTPVGTRDDGLLLTDPYPALGPNGPATLITWTATDDCGNQSTCTQTVTVNPVSTMMADVHLAGSFTDDFTRCITFELRDCSGGVTTLAQDIAFDNGAANDVAITVPCGGWTCVTARDRKHTLRRSATPSGFAGPNFDVAFSGVDALEGGNLNDDQFVDILDFGIFVGQFGPGNIGGNTLCGHVGFHADITGDGFVQSGDFSFIQINFFDAHEANCCGLPNDEGELRAGPIDRIAVRDLQRMGLPELIRADLNRDGWLDQADVAVFVQNGGHP